MRSGGMFSRRLLGDLALPSGGGKRWHEDSSERVMRKHGMRSMTALCVIKVQLRFSFNHEISDV